ncbi:MULTISPECIES: peptidase M23 [unclassified Micromonospora]|uniref:peptidase M23 n=1 Tax=unclassified Micromonospora TaxID=2617518 RepID=UPI002FEF0CF6
MRDDDTIDDQYAHEGPTGRSDDTPSSVQVGVLRVPAATPTLRTRLGALVNPLIRRPSRVALASGVVSCLALAALAGAQALPAERLDPVAAQPALAERAQEDAASRDHGRTPVNGNPGTPGKASTDSSSRDEPRKAKPRPTPKPRPKRIAPVAGLDRAQMENAKAIVKAGREMGVPRQALIIAVATAMQESNLYNYASGVLPESQNYPHQAIGWDHDSVGLFQQRPSSGWGAVRDLMDPEYATQAFLSALLEIPGWRDLPLTVAAQSVQVSAFPDLYAQHEWRATKVVEAILA